MAHLALTVVFSELCDGCQGAIVDWHPDASQTALARFSDPTRALGDAGSTIQHPSRQLFLTKSAFSQRDVLHKNKKIGISKYLE